MAFARFAGSAFIDAALLTVPALAEPADTAKAVDKDASWLLLQAGQTSTASALHQS